MTIPNKTIKPQKIPKDYLLENRSKYLKVQRYVINKYVPGCPRKIMVFLQKQELRRLGWIQIIWVLDFTKNVLTMILSKILTEVFAMSFLCIGIICATNTLLNTVPFQVHSTTDEINPFQSGSLCLLVRFVGGHAFKLQRFTLCYRIKLHRLDVQIMIHKM